MKYLIQCRSTPDVSPLASLLLGICCKCGCLEVSSCCGIAVGPYSAVVTPRSQDSVFFFLRLFRSVCVYARCKQ